MYVFAQLFNVLSWARKPLNKPLTKVAPRNVIAAVAIGQVMKSVSVWPVVVICVLLFFYCCFCCLFFSRYSWQAST